ncbi:hypothetical protein FQZ97_622440 [compost metagenome]
MKAGRPSRAMCSRAQRAASQTANGFMPSTLTAAMPWPCGRVSSSVWNVDCSTLMETAYLLFSRKKIMGRPYRAARFMASCVAP